MLKRLKEMCKTPELETPLTKQSVTEFFKSIPFVESRPGTPADGEIQEPLSGNRPSSR